MYFEKLRTGIPAASYMDSMSHLVVIKLCKNMDHAEQFYFKIAFF